MGAGGFDERLIGEDIMKPGERFKTSGGQDDYGAFLPPDPAVDIFLAEIVEVCKKHGMSISHEDDHGGFSDSDVPRGQHQLAAGCFRRPSSRQAMTIWHDIDEMATLLGKPTTRLVLQNDWPL
jgi:hypothetical protein